MLCYILCLKMVPWSGSPLLKTQVWEAMVSWAQVNAADTGRCLASAPVHTTSTSGVKGFLLPPIWGPSFDVWFSLPEAFLAHFKNFIRRNIIDYVIKCKTYIIKISEHFTGHLIKTSGAMPKGINLH